MIVLFFGSGCAALIYEIVWFQTLELCIGSSAVCLGMLLATFMGGLCLGSLAPSRFIIGKQASLRTWALLEFGIGMFGLLVLVAAAPVARSFAGGLEGLPGMVLRGLLAGCLLLPATILMGAALPVASRCVESDAQGISRLGVFYAANVTGAVLGALLTGFYLLRLHDMPTATGVAVAINLTIGVGALVLSSKTDSGQGTAREGVAGASPEDRPQTQPFDPTPCGHHPRSRIVHLVIGVSGFCALAAEVLWTRLLSLILGPTVYAFSIILAVFLAGLGIGSFAGAVVARRAARPGLALAWCQVLITAAIAWTAYTVCNSLPYWPINPSLSRSMWHTMQLDLLRCAWAILPAPILWGASFPLALAAAGRPGIDPAHLVGAVYAANTLGAVSGSVGASLILVASIGTQATERLLVILSAGAALLMFMSELSSRGPEGALAAGAVRRFSPMAALATTMVLAGLMAWRIPQVPWQVVAYGRNLPSKTTCGTKLYVGEGQNATVAVTQVDEKTRLFHVSGKVEASSAAQDMRLQRMLGHLPALVHAEPASVLVVGCGAGVTAGSFLPHPDVRKIVVCEIEPLIPRHVTPWFTAENYGVLRDSRVDLHYDDARHYLLASRERFDIITSDPIHPWVKGAATLFTREYLEMCKQHLKPGGLVTQWLPLYDSNIAAVKSAVATFMQAFPNGTIWANCDFEEGYDVVLLGSTAPLVINLDEMQKRLARPDHRAVAQSLRDVSFRSALSLLATYAGQGPDLQNWLAGAQVNRDSNLRLQYLAGSGINLDDRTTIYMDLVRHRRYPNELFQCTSVWEQALKRAIGP